jgi:hypothetical protein
MKRIGWFVLPLCTLLWFANITHAQEKPQQVPAAVISDPVYPKNLVAFDF